MLILRVLCEQQEFSSKYCKTLGAHHQLAYSCRYNPIKTTKTSFLGTMNMLGLAKRTNAKLLLASTSEVYGDPLVHPQPESYFGNVNPIGERSCYDEGVLIPHWHCAVIFQKCGVHAIQGLIRYLCNRNDACCTRSLDCIIGCERFMKGFSSLKFLVIVLGQLISIW